MISELHRSDRKSSMMKESAMNAADVMVRQVITIRPEATIRDLATLLVENHISAVPVTDADGKLVGIISESDLLRRSETETERRRSWWLALFVSNDTLTTEFIKSHSRKVSDVMTRGVIVARPDTPLHEIATLLEHHRIKRVPVIQDGKIAGLVSRADLVRALTISPEASTLSTVPDDVALRDAVMENLEKESWASTALINVTARSGKIDLTGLVRSVAQRDALRIAVELTPGVKAVNDDLTVRPIIETV
jgi:CBS domain-containing protein